MKTQLNDVSRGPLCLKSGRKSSCCAKKVFFFCLFFMIWAATAVAQQATRVISGTVTDTNGETLPGVSVRLKNTGTVVQTDAKGSFRMPIPSQGGILMFSFVGYTSVEQVVGNSATMNISLSLASTMLDEVVAIGYGTINRRDLTGAVASVKGDELTKAIPFSVNESLQGRIAGVNVNRNDGAPGAGISITIRGTNSFTGSEPLYVVDGIPFTSAQTPAGAEDNFQTINPLSFLNPQDIESIEVLKDASATAIYGSRGANGVVLITTKKGAAGVDKVEFISNTSLASVSKRVDMLDAYHYALFQNEAYANYSTYEGTALTVPFPGEVTLDQVTGREVYTPKPEDYLTGLPEGTAYPTGFRGTNWQDQIFHHAVSQDYTLRFSGGNDKGTYSLSGNYLNQKGIIINSGFKRYNAQLNVERKINDFLLVGTNNNVSYTTFQFGKTNTSGAQPSLISSALYFPPTYPLDDPNSDLRENAINNSNLANPYKTLHSSRDMTYSTRVYTGAYIQLNFTPFLNLRERIGYNYNTNKRETYYGRDINEGRAPIYGRGSIGDNNYKQFTSEAILSFNKVYDEKHSINAMGAFTYEQGDADYQTMSATNFPTDITKNFNLRAGLVPSPLQNGRQENSLMSFLGRVNYSYLGKYLFTASFRRDGSSKFAENNKWANFSSFALAWNAGEESFVKELNVFSNLKLRASYGQTGNQGIGPYGSVYSTVVSNVPINGSILSGFSIDENKGFVDENIKWETTTQYDAGMDMGFWKNRVNVTVDVYLKRTKDLLQSIQIPMSSGFRTMLTNFGTVENKGLEITADASLIQGATFKWDVSGNIAFNRNKILDLPADQYANRLWYPFDQIFLQRNGHAIGTIFGLKEDGFYDSIEEVKADPQYASLSAAEQLAKVGEIKYQNVDDDPSGLSQTTDRAIIGNTNPNYIFGLTNNFSYKKFTLSVFVQGSVGGDILNSNLLKVTMSQLGNIPQFAYDTRWTPDNTENAKWPKANASASRAYLFSDRFIEDGTFVRLKNINLGYTFTPRSKYLSALNLYFSVSNVFTISDYSWFDPDVNSFGGDASRRGVDMNSYPNSRMFTLGLKASL
ncbi:TonB-dependent receptor [Olivibacter sp. SA151]|uniref:SusC/RagA family TonB-linked outer membrane protein n=1 Tax=Olivibacter jilunii TaxID=985016 RepID=UPI003F18C18E